MSCTLVWKPVVDEYVRLDDITLRNILEKKFRYPHQLSNEHIEYLQGLVDAGIDDANELIEAIEKYNVIEIDKIC